MRNLIQGKRSLVILPDRAASSLTNVEQDDDSLLIFVKEEWSAEERLAHAKKVLKMWRDAPKV